MLRQIRGVMEAHSTRRSAIDQPDELAYGSDTDCKTVDIEGVVEYKSLPSGLHNVTEDLVYVQAARDAPLQLN